MSAAALAVTAGGALTDVGRALREAFFMFWETLWPLVLGFGLSGAVQAFVSRSRMERTLGDHRPAALARAGVFGMVSSSCSYAASAMAKSLFQKGADFVSAVVFMFASTNLVVELGIVLVVLLGWQFAAAEFVGGPIMIVLLGVLGGMVFTPRLVRGARARLAAMTAHTNSLDAHEHAVPASGDTGLGDGGRAPRPPIRTLAGWSDAAGFTLSDLRMLRRELALGYLIAGFLAVLVPTVWWNAVFVHGHGAWTSVENVVVGPVIAFLSFVCSIGNVPMAAALWQGGISFGGVVSFLFADLLAAPLVLIYRRYYGTALTVRLVALFWAVMAVAGLAVQGIFGGAGLVPARRHTQLVPTAFHWNATTFLNIVSLVVFVVLLWLERNRGRFAGDAATIAADPVCGMQVRTADAPAMRVDHDAWYWFCSDQCAETFDADPGRYRQRTDPTRTAH